MFLGYNYRIMLKKLAIIVVTTALIVAVILVVRYDKIHDTEGKGYDVKCTQPSEPSATMNPLICTAEHSQKAENGKSNPPWWHVFFAWPEGITALLVMLTLGVIGLQTLETRKAAEAALKQANHIVASERAWMSPHIIQPNYVDIMEAGGKPYGWFLPIQVYITNRGKTPAVIISGLLDYSSELTVDAEAMPPLQPNLSETVRYINEPTKYPPGSVYVSGDNPSLVRTIPREFLLRENASWRSREKCLCVKGFMEYRDVFNKKTHISRFCYAYQITQVGGGFTDETTGKQVFPPEFMKAGPDAYNEIT
jgi:hypothetical protein